jgi:hypothetical protein
LEQEGMEIYTIQKITCIYQQNGYYEFLKKADEGKGPFGRLKSG